MSDFTSSLVAMKDAVTEMKETATFYEEKSQDVVGWIALVENLLATCVLEVPAGGRYLLLFPLNEGDFQFHGTFTLMNYTTPFVCNLHLKKSYNSSDVLALSQTKFGNLGMSVCSLTYDDVEYLALRNDGEDNRVWRFMGQLTSSEYIRAIDNSQVNENHVSIYMTTQPVS